MTGSITPEINELLRRQTTAGIGGNSPLSEDEQNRLRDFYNQEGQKGVGEIIPPEINELLKRQANADIKGNPSLTQEEREKLRQFYVSRK